MVSKQHKIVPIFLAILLQCFFTLYVSFFKQILSDILLLPRSLTKLALEYVCLLKHNFLIQSHDNGEYQDGDL